MKLAVATPAYGEVLYAPYVRSLLRLQRKLHERKDRMSHTLISFAEVSEARNFLLTHWYDKSDASHILFVDADMGFEPELIFRMLALKKPVVGVIYPRRQIDLARVTASAKKGETQARAVARAHDFILRPVQRKAARRTAGFLEVAGCGAGILLIERSCIVQMLKKLPELNDKGAAKTSPLAEGLDRLIRGFDSLTVGDARLSEDFAFCHRWHELCGGEIWADTDAEVTHIGLHRFSARYADAGGGQRIEIVSKPMALHVGGEAGEGLTVKEGKGPRVVRGKLNLPKPAKKNGGKPAGK